MNLFTFGLADAFLSSKNLKSFVCTDADGAKGGINTLTHALNCLCKIGIFVHLLNNQDLATEVEPPGANTIGLELNMTCKKLGEE